MVLTAEPISNNEVDSFNSHTTPTDILEGAEHDAAFTSDNNDGNTSRDNRGDLLTNSQEILAAVDKKEQVKACVYH